MTGSVLVVNGLNMGHQVRLCPQSRVIDFLMNYEKIIEAIANLAHNKFIKIYREVNNGTRVKTTKDKEWIEKHGTDQADLAKLTYSELPSDWKNERRSGAKVALNILQKAIDSNRRPDEEFIEHASNLIHEEWLKRNLDRAEDEHKLSYDQLSEEAKEKDRIFIHAAMEIYKKAT